MVCTDAAYLSCRNKNNLYNGVFSWYYLYNAAISWYAALREGLPYDTIAFLITLVLISCDKIPSCKAGYASCCMLDPSPFEISSCKKTQFCGQLCSLGVCKRIKQLYEESMANRSNRVCEWEVFLPWFTCLPPSINLLIRGSSRLCNASNPTKDWVGLSSTT